MCSCTIYSSFQTKTNPLWPQFEDAVKLEKTIVMPELVSGLTYYDVFNMCIPPLVFSTVCCEH